MPLNTDYSYRSISEKENLCSWGSEETLVPFNHGSEMCSHTCPHNKSTALENLNIPKLGWERDKLGAWDEHTHTTIYKIDNQQGPTV